MEYFAEGSNLLLGDGTTAAAPGEFTELGCVVTLTPSRKTRNFREIRPCLQATDRTVRNSPTDITIGDVSVTIRFNEDTHGLLAGYLDSGAAFPLAEVLGDTGKALCSMWYVADIGPDQLSEGGEVTASVTFRSAAIDWLLIDAPEVGS